MMKFQPGGKSNDAYLAIPDGGKGRGVLVLHAWWGLTGFFKSLCDRLADDGFVALAPDLYHGKTASTVDRAKQLGSKLKNDIVARELSGAVAYLRSNSAAVGERIGVVGFSMGGYYALGLARQRLDDIAAAVVFYGMRTLDYRETKAAFLGHFAEDDKWAPSEKVRKLEERIRAAGREVNFYTYPGTKHWFFEEDRPDAYDANASRLAWYRTVDFLRNRL
jgi:carboxymethylenebutenolidase